MGLRPSTLTPSGRAMFQMMGVFAEFERAKERGLAGLARANENGTALGRPHLEDSNPEKVSAIKAALATRWMRPIARDLGAGVCTVYRIRAAEGAPSAATNALLTAKDFQNCAALTWSSPQAPQHSHGALHRAVTVRAQGLLTGVSAVRIVLAALGISFRTLLARSQSK